MGQIYFYEDEVFEQKNLIFKPKLGQKGHKIGKK